MKRSILAVLAATVLGLAAALPVGADTVGDASPACADIVSGGAFYHFASDPANTVTGSVLVNAASCHSIFYEMWVSYTRDGRTVRRVVVEKGDGTTPVVRFQLNNVAADGGTAGTVCVGFSTSQGSHLLDSAPDAFSPPTTGCVTIVADAGGGESFW